MQVRSRPGPVKVAKGEVENFTSGLTGGVWLNFSSLVVFFFFCLNTRIRSRIREGGGFAIDLM